MARNKNYGTVTVTTKKLVRQYGKEYTSAVLPADIKRGPPTKCFDWCALQAALFSKNRKDGKYRYVEGFAADPETGHWILHAWLTDGEHAFDPTWLAFYDSDNKEAPLPTYYYGIEIPITSVWRFMKKTGYQSLLGNRWRDPELVDTILERTKKL